jgi:hypothetical protein
MTRRRAARAHTPTLSYHAAYSSRVSLVKSPGREPVSAFIGMCTVRSSDSCISASGMLPDRLLLERYSPLQGGDEEKQTRRRYRERS